MEHLEYKNARNYSRRMLIDILIFFYIYRIDV